MSHHKHGYRIYPEDDKSITDDKWKKADRWINGVEFRNDFNEAVAFAKIGARSCGIPFVVVEVPLGGVRPKLCDCWVIDV